jgi:hypothetical protein
VPDGTADFPFAKLSSARSDFLLTNLYTSDNTLKKADSTFVESRAEVSRKNNPCFSANSFASSVRTWRKLLRSDLFPTNIIVMLVSECDFSSSSHLCVCSNETRLVMSYTSTPRMARGENGGGVVCQGAQRRQERGRNVVTGLRIHDEKGT